MIGEMLPAFRKAGETLLACGCNNSHSGNLSVHRGPRLIITRTGAMLGRLGEDDLVLTSLEPTENERKRASTELCVHLEIYLHTAFSAIAHGHALAAVAVGWLGDVLKPVDVEGALYFGEIPVIECSPATASPELGRALAERLVDVPVVIVRGHGVFAAGDTLEQAMQRVTSVNDSAALVLRARGAGLDVAKLAEADYLRFNR